MVNVAAVFVRENSMRSLRCGTEVQLLPSVPETGLILTSGAVRVEFTRSSCDLVGFLQVLRFRPTLQRRVLCRLIELCKLPLVCLEWMRMWDNRIGVNGWSTVSVNSVSQKAHFHVVSSTQSFTAVKQYGYSSPVTPRTAISLSQFPTQPLNGSLVPDQNHIITN